MLDLKKENGDVVIAGDDLVVAYSDNQHRADLLLWEKGSVKQYLDAGVGAATFIESEDPAGLLKEVSLQYTADGMDVQKIGLQDGKLVIEAPYK